MPESRKRKAAPRKAKAKKRRSSAAGAKATLDELEAVFAALAHPSRRHILLVLHFRGGEMTAGDIAQRFECSWPTTTRHLGVLRDAGLITVQREGRTRRYQLDRERLLSVGAGWFAPFSKA